MNLDYLSKQPNKEEKAQREMAVKIKAFIDELKEVEIKHKLRILPALDASPNGIIPSFRFEEIKDELPT